MKKILCILTIILFVGGLTTGCTTKSEPNKLVKERTDSVQVKKPEPNPISKEQAKHPLEKDSQPFTGKIIKVEGKKVLVDVKGATLEFEVTKDTNIQKGGKAFGGKIEELKPGMEVNCLVKEGRALAVAYL